MTMDRRRFLKLGAASALGASLWGDRAAAAEVTGPPVDARARRPMIIDALGEISDPNLPDGSDGVAGIDERSLEEALASGLTAFNQTVGYVAGPLDPFEQSVRDVAAWDAFIRRHPRELLKVLSAGDLRQAHADRRLGVILGFQNGAMMGQDASRAAVFADLGVRVVQLTYNVRNQLGDGSMVAENRGLTPLGREVVEALNDRRVLVDLSHSGERTCLDAVAASKAPVIVSHTGCRALADLPRNKTDQELRAVAERGGVVGLYFMPFLAIGRQPTARDLLAHLEHALKHCGEDHVALGSDGTVPAIDDMARYREHLKVEVASRKAAGIGATGERDDIVPFLPDLQGPEKFWRLAELMEGRGHRTAVIDKVLGANVLRLAAAVW